MEQLGKAIQIVGSAAVNILNFEPKKQDLKRKLEELESIAKHVKILVGEAQSSSGKRRKNVVDNWLRNVERIKNEVQSIEHEAGLSRWSTALGSRLEKLTEEVMQLINKGKFEGGVAFDAHDTRGDLLLVPKMVGPEFERNVDYILKCLANDEILKIGIYGMGGVGKTTLVTHIHNIVLENSYNFDYVYWVTVSHDSSIYKLQSLVAKNVGLDISDEDDEMKRAAKLAKELKRKHKCILILDDLWNHFSEEKIGIQENGCKLILTTRSLEVCRRMGCHVKINVEPLSEGEAWNLFVQKLGHEIPLAPNINKIAKSIVKECDGLPLGIITVAASMRGADEVCEWRDVLRELKESEIRQDDMEERVFRVLRFSYNLLNNQALEHCLLYCALFPEDFEIERGELIEYLIVEGIIEGMSSRQAQFDKGHLMLNKLENVCLLEGSSKDGYKRYVKMHGLIRDMAVQIMKSGPNAAMVEAGKQLTKIPHHEGKYWREDHVRVSLISNFIREIPSTCLLRCPNLSTLLLRGNSFSNGIAVSFFNYFHRLKVLDLSYTGLKQLPASIDFLEKLTALLLRGCDKLEYVPPLAKLRELKKLDLNGTGLEEVPEGVELQSNLTYLNFIGTAIKNFPCGVLSKLSHLQFFGWYCRSSETSELIMEEVLSLQKLEILLCWFTDFRDFNTFVLSLSDYGIERQKLSKYSLIVCPNWREKNDIFYDDLNLYSRAVEFRTSKVSKEIYLPSDIEELSIFDLYIEDGRSLCLKNAIELKSLTIKGCKMMESLFDLSSSPYIFQSLEILELYELDKLRVLFSGDDRDTAAPVPTAIPLTPYGAFSNLRTFKMHNCCSMRKLFHPALMRNLQNLEALELKFCLQMEETMAAEELEGRISPSGSDHSIFLQNEFNVPNLSPPPNAAFCSLKTFHMSGCISMKKLFHPALIRNLQNLEELEVSSCYLMEEIIAEGGNGTSSNNYSIFALTNEFILPKLRVLLLSSLLSLKSICSGKMICNSLQEIEVQYCENLENIPLSLPLPSLQKIKVYPKQWWESVEWDHSSDKRALQPLCIFR